MYRVASNAALTSIRTLHLGLGFITTDGITLQLEKSGIAYNLPYLKLHESQTNLTF